MIKSNVSPSVQNVSFSNFCLKHKFFRKSYTLQELEKGKKWLFTYYPVPGKAKCHLIRSFNLGKIRIYKNGSAFFSSSFKELLSHLVGDSIESYCCI